jgi:hypothetical protein
MARARHMAPCLAGHASPPRRAMCVAIAPHPGEDCEFRRDAMQVFIGPLLKIKSFQDIATTLMPAMLPGEGSISEEPFVPFFPILPKDEA